MGQLLLENKEGTQIAPLRNPGPASFTHVQPVTELCREEETGMEHLQAQDSHWQIHVSLLKTRVPPLACISQFSLTRYHGWILALPSVFEIIKHPQHTGGWIWQVVYEYHFTSLHGYDNYFFFLSCHLSEHLQDPYGQIPATGIAKRLNTFIIQLWSSYVGLSLAL